MLCTQTPRLLADDGVEQENKTGESVAETTLLYDHVKRGPIIIIIAHGLPVWTVESKRAVQLDKVHISFFLMVEWWCIFGLGLFPNNGENGVAVLN